MLEHSRPKNKWLIQPCDRICSVMSCMSVKWKLLSQYDKSQRVWVAGWQGGRTLPRGRHIHLLHQYTPRVHHLWGGGRSVCARDCVVHICVWAYMYVSVCCFFLFSSFLRRKRGKHELPERADHLLHYLAHYDFSVGNIIQSNLSWKAAFQITYISFRNDKHPWAPTGHQALL